MEVEAQEVTEHEQAMVDLVDAKAVASEGAANPENAEEYVEPTPEGDVDAEVDYKAKYEELLSKGGPEESPESKGLDIPEETKDVPSIEEAKEVSALTPEQMGKYNNEFNTNGSLADSSYQELHKLGLSKDVVDSYIQGQSAIQQAQHTKAYDAVGGKDSYTEMVTWAKESWTPEQVNVFNTQVQSGNDDQIMFGIDSLKAQFKAANGSPLQKRALSGSSAGGSQGNSKGYENKGEMYKAMRSPMYGKDASYTNSVAKKIEQSAF